MSFILSYSTCFIGQVPTEQLESSIVVRSRAYNLLRMRPQLTSSPSSFSFLAHC
jgi:hypothetical protein